MKVNWEARRKRWGAWKDAQPMKKFRAHFQYRAGGRVRLYVLVDARTENEAKQALLAYEPLALVSQVVEEKPL